MSATELLDLPSLLKPIPGADDPGGVPLDTATRSELDKLRKDADPAFEETAGLRADWPKVISLCTELLRTKSKDLTLAARLTEALTKKHGLPGLHAGLQLWCGLMEECWDSVYPRLDPDDPDDDPRRTRIEWLNDTIKGGRFPETVMRLPLVEIDREEYCMIDSLTEDRNNQLLGELPRCPTELIKSAFEQMKACQGELTRFAKLADDKLGAHSPDLTSNSGSNLGTAVEKCMDFLRNIAKLRGVMLEASADEPDNAPQAQTPTGVGAKNNTTGQVGGSREQLYAQIQSIAQALKRIEPHSPIPYLLERCVRLGQLPFPELMREVIQESSTLDELDRLIGVKREE